MRAYQGDAQEKHFVQIPPEIEKSFSEGAMIAPKPNLTVGEQKVEQVPNQVTATVPVSSLDNLEDKVKSGPRGNDSKIGPLKNKRDTKKPVWSKDFVFKY